MHWHQESLSSIFTNWHMACKKLHMTIIIIIMIIIIIIIIIINSGDLMLKQ